MVLHIPIFAGMTATKRKDIADSPTPFGAGFY
jgi:hypothetical protein